MSPCMPLQTIPKIMQQRSRSTSVSANTPIPNHPLMIAVLGRCCSEPIFISSTTNTNNNPSITTASTPPLNTNKYARHDDIWLPELVGYIPSSSQPGRTEKEASMTIESTQENWLPTLTAQDESEEEEEEKMHAYEHTYERDPTEDEWRKKVTKELVEMGIHDTSSILCYDWDGGFMAAAFTSSGRCFLAKSGYMNRDRGLSLIENTKKDFSYISPNNSCGIYSHDFDDFCFDDFDLTSTLFENCTFRTGCNDFSRHDASFVDCIIKDETGVVNQFNK